MSEQQGEIVTDNVRKEQEMEPTRCVLCGDTFQEHYTLGNRKVCYDKDPQKMAVITGKYFTSPDPCQDDPTEQACDDKTCPCQDGDPCHYEDTETTKAMQRPTEQEIVPADEYLNALLRYSSQFYGFAVEAGISSGQTADAMKHVESAARQLHKLANDALRDLAEADRKHAFACKQWQESDERYAADLVAAREQIAQEEKESLKLIDERDQAEEAVGDAFALVTGEQAEWSNLFGYTGANERIAYEMKTLREQIARLESEKARAFNDGIHAALDLARPEIGIRTVFQIGDLLRPTPPQEGPTQQEQTR